VGVPRLDEKRRCIHCNRIFRVGDYKVYRDRSDMEFIVCPDSPEYDGTLIDWIPVDWVITRHYN